MTRRWNIPLWAGVAVALLAVLSYIPFFSRFPATRDFPWANLLLFLAAGCLLAGGLRRAFAGPTKLRVRIGAAILSGMSILLFGLFCYGVFYEARKVPPPGNALRVGQQAPDFILADVHDKPVTLTGLRQGKRAVVLIFYRGYW